jgi:hypothetical protein
MTKRDRRPLDDVLNPAEKAFVYEQSQEKLPDKSKKTPKPELLEELKATGKTQKARLTIEIDQALYQAICDISAATGRSKKDVIEFALRKVIPVQEE